ncbi:MAG: MBL fold metallo-hydrolase [Ruminococcus flavefaciens]|nr:MBL fold metallo-hydrolase [Ruminococcus flavefaciens]
MNIRLLGTGSIWAGSIWAEELGACALIDGTILLDCPNGLIKIMRKKKININNIDVCIITHFHADHYFDIPFLLLEQ